MIDYKSKKWNEIAKVLKMGIKWKKRIEM